MAFNSSICLPAVLLMKLLLRNKLWVKVLDSTNYSLSQQTKESKPTKKLLNHKEDSTLSLDDCSSSVDNIASNPTVESEIVISATHTETSGCASKTSVKETSRTSDSNFSSNRPRQVRSCLNNKQTKKDEMKDKVEIKKSVHSCIDISRIQLCQQNPASSESETDSSSIDITSESYQSAWSISDVENVTIVRLCTSQSKEMNHLINQKIRLLTSSEDMHDSVISEQTKKIHILTSSEDMHDSVISEQTKKIHIPTSSEDMLNTVISEQTKKIRILTSSEDMHDSMISEQTKKIHIPTSSEDMLDSVISEQTKKEDLFESDRNSVHLTINDSTPSQIEISYEKSSLLKTSDSTLPKVSEPLQMPPKESSVIYEREVMSSFKTLEEKRNEIINRSKLTESNTEELFQNNFIFPLHEKIKFQSMPKYEKNLNSLKFSFQEKLETQNGTCTEKHCGNNSEQENHNQTDDLSLHCLSKLKISKPKSETNLTLSYKTEFKKAAESGDITEQNFCDFCPPASKRFRLQEKLKVKPSSQSNQTTQTIKFKPDVKPSGFMNNTNSFESIMQLVNKKDEVKTTLSGIGSCGDSCANQPNFNTLRNTGPIWRTKKKVNKEKNMKNASFEYRNQSNGNSREISSYKPKQLLCVAQRKPQDGNKQDADVGDHIRPGKKTLCKIGYCPLFQNKPVMSADLTPPSTITTRFPSVQKTDSDQAEASYGAGEKCFKKSEESKPIIGDTVTQTVKSASFARPSTTKIEKISNSMFSLSCNASSNVKTQKVGSTCSEHLTISTQCPLTSDSESSITKKSHQVLIAIPEKSLPSSETFNRCNMDCFAVQNLPSETISTENSIRAKKFTDIKNENMVKKNKKFLEINRKPNTFDDVTSGSAHSNYFLKHLHWTNNEEIFGLSIPPENELQKYKEPVVFTQKTHKTIESPDMTYVCGTCFKKEESYTSEFSNKLEKSNPDRETQLKRKTPKKLQQSNYPFQTANFRYNRDKSFYSTRKSDKSLPKGFRSLQRADAECLCHCGEDSSQTDPRLKKTVRHIFLSKSDVTTNSGINENAFLRRAKITRSEFSNDEKISMSSREVIKQWINDSPFLPQPNQLAATSSMEAGYSGRSKSSFHTAESVVTAESLYTNAFPSSDAETIIMHPSAGSVYISN